MTVAVIDYGSGNLKSAAKAVEHAGKASGLDTPVRVTDKADEVAAAERIVLPGVGAFADCMAALAALDGVVAALNAAVIDKGRPFLGICVGMQLMAERGREYGVTEGLGWVPGAATKIEPDDSALKIPHMGWNTLELTAAGENHPFLAGLGADRDVYFVHSYAFRAADPTNVLATTDYDGPVTAVIGRDNMVGTQFHPEKSQRVGLTVMANFLKWRP